MNFCIFQARVGRCLSAFHNKNPITSQSERSVLGCGSGSGFTHPYFEEYAFYVGIAAAGLCIKLCGNIGLFFFIFSLVAQTASWDAR